MLRSSIIGRAPRHANGVFHRDEPTYLVTAMRFLVEVRSSPSEEAFSKKLL